MEWRIFCRLECKDIIYPIVPIAITETARQYSSSGTVVIIIAVGR